MIAYWAYALLVVALDRAAGRPEQRPRHHGRAAQCGQEVGRAANRSASRAFSSRRLGTEPSQDPGKRNQQRQIAIPRIHEPGGRPGVNSPLRPSFSAHRRPTTRAQRRRQSIVLEVAPRRGAPIRPAFGPQPGQGRPAGGRTTERPVTIRSDWKEPGPEDDLLVVTPATWNSPSRPSPRRPGRASNGARTAAAARTWSSSS